MSVSYRKIRDLISGLDFVFGSFTYEGLEHVIVEQKNTDLSSPAWHTFPSSLVRGVQINISSWVDSRFLKPIILHEFLEWLIREEFRIARDSYFYKKGSRKIAHVMASKFDEMYARELFDSATLRDYIGFKRSFN